MDTFQIYETRPTQRLAHQITEDDRILNTDQDGYSLLITPTGTKITFSNNKDMKTGDYVIFLNKEDIYHCYKEVFENSHYVV